MNNKKKQTVKKRLSNGTIISSAIEKSTKKKRVAAKAATPKKMVLKTIKNVYDIEFTVSEDFAKFIENTKVAVKKMKQDTTKEFSKITAMEVSLQKELMRMFQNKKELMVEEVNAIDEKIANIDCKIDEIEDIIQELPTLDLEDFYE